MRYLDTLILTQGLWDAFIPCAHLTGSRMLPELIMKESERHYWNFGAKAHVNSVANL
jgi:hypothetical protein